jgi:flagellar hook assembly protein FlgD
MQNYPNPFKSSTTIRYALPERSQLTLRIYTILGQEVATLEDGTVEPGYRSVTWRGTDRLGHPLPPGLYVYRLQARSLNTGMFRQVRKMVLLQ